MKGSPVQDLKGCRTEHLFSNYWRCLAEDGDFCPYGYSFRGQYICKHPESYEFADGM